MNRSLNLCALLMSSLVIGTVVEAQESASETKTTPRMVIVQMRVLELDEAKLRERGIDYEVAEDRGKFSTMGGRASLPLSVTKSFVKDDMAKEISGPSVVIRANGQPAQYLAGGETPVRYYKYIMYKQFGTVVDMSATFIDEAHVRLDIDYLQTDLDISRAPALPSFPTRRCQTTCDIELGQRIALPVTVNPTEGKLAKPTVMILLVEKSD